MRELAWDLPALWHNGAAPFDLKKRIVRAAVKEIVVYVEATAIRIFVHWQGGQHTGLNIQKRKTGEHRWKTADSTVTLIEQLARLMSGRQIAAQLNRMGIKTAKGYGWTRSRAGNFRTDNAIQNYVPGERQARGELTVEEVASRLGALFDRSAHDHTASPSCPPSLSRFAVDHPCGRCRHSPALCPQTTS